jgi:hypothetical protein
MFVDFLSVLVPDTTLTHNMNVDVVAIVFCVG